MAWIMLEMPLFPRTRRTIDGTYYRHDGQGRVRVRPHHVVELLHQQGVHRAPAPESLSVTDAAGATAAPVRRRR